MHISFRTTKLQREFESERDLRRNRGKQQAEKIKIRMIQLEGVQNLKQLLNQPGHFHELKEDRDGWLACDLDGQNRLIFECTDQPIPLDAQRGLDWQLVTAVRILGVLDYHERNKKQPI